MMKERKMKAKSNVRHTRPVDMNNVMPGKATYINRKRATQIMREVAAKHRIKLVFLTEDEGRGGYNYGGSTGDQIFLAPFAKVPSIRYMKVSKRCENPVECMLAAFFHEFAHCKLGRSIPCKEKGFSWNGTSRMQFEVWITMAGFAYALKKHGIRFSDATFKWLLAENYTYGDNPVDALRATSVDEDSYVLERNSEILRK